MLGVRTEAGAKCLCFFLSLFTGALLRLPLLVFPAPDPSWCCPFSLFCSFFFLFVSSLFFSSFLTHVLHLLHLSPPSSSFISSIFFLHLFPLLLQKVPFSIWALLKQSLGRTLETNLTKHPIVYLSVLLRLSLLRQFTFCIGLFEPLFVRCNNFSY